MIKAVELFFRRPGMPYDEFYDYWLNEHSKVVLGLDGLIRYVQSHPVQELYEGGAMPFDGVVETWFESLDVMKRNGASDYWDVVVADEEAFIDRSTVGVLLADEHVIKDGDPAAGGVKTIKVMHRKPGMDVEEFQRHWRETHGPMVADLPGVLRHEQNHARLGAYKSGIEIACDGLGLTWFENIDSLKACGAAPEHVPVTEDTANFLDLERTMTLVVKEHLIKG